MYHPHSHFPQGTCLSLLSISSGIFFYPFMITKDCRCSRQSQMHSCIGKVGISHPVCRRFHRGPQIISSHSHPERTESSSGLRKSKLHRREIQRGQRLELSSSALHQHSPSAGQVLQRLPAGATPWTISWMCLSTCPTGRAESTLRHETVSREEREPWRRREKKATWKQFPREF